MENQKIIPEMKEELSEIKMPKINKNTRFYYRHREEIVAKRRERLEQEPEYQRQTKTETNTETETSNLIHVHQ
jgi:hypothetical protein